MKELSIEKKAKRYEKAIERAEGLIDFCSDSELKTLEYVFPELRESRDEKIRKELIEFIKSRGGFKQEYIAWLEKQGNSIDKVEPKFKVGDILVSEEEDKRHIYKVEAITNYDTYLLLDLEDGYTKNESVYTTDLAMYLWTIEDVRDGDIVVEDKIPGHPSPFIAIFKEIGTDSDTFNSRCFIDFDGNFNEGDIGHDLSNIHPATKKQRDILITKMKEARLTDFEKSLEHIMIETLECGDTRNLKADAEMLLRFAQKPIKWSEKDEKMLNDIISDVKFEGYNNDLQASSYRKINWLNSLKDNIKFNYSKDDKMLDKIMQIVSNYWNSIPDSNIDENEEVESCYNWLKSLK